MGEVERQTMTAPLTLLKTIMPSSLCEATKETNSRVQQATFWITHWTSGCLFSSFLRYVPPIIPLLELQVHITTSSWKSTWISITQHVLLEPSLSPVETRWWFNTKGLEVQIPRLESQFGHLLDDTGKDVHFFLDFTFLFAKCACMIYSKYYIKD